MGLSLVSGDVEPGGAIRSMAIDELPQVVAVGISRVAAPHDFGEHLLAYPELNFIVAGRYTTLLNGAPGSARTGHVYGYDAGDVFSARSGPDDGVLVCRWLRFAWPVRRAGATLRVPRACALDGPTQARFLTLFDQAHSLQRQDHLAARLRASAALLEILALLLDATAATTTVRPIDRRIAAGRAVLERDQDRPVRIAVAARAAGMRPDSFIRAFRRVVGVTPLQHLIALRLATARQLLLGEPDLAIETVARRSGFSDARHFARLFRRRFGLPPSALRARLVAP